MLEKPTFQILILTGKSGQDEPPRKMSNAKYSLSLLLLIDIIIIIITIVINIKAIINFYSNGNSPLSTLPLFILCQLAYGRWVLTFEVWPPFVILPPTKSIPQVIARGRTRLKVIKFVCREERFKRKLIEISVVHELVERETLSSLVLSSLSGVTNYDFITTYCINLFCTRNVLKRK